MSLRWSVERSLLDADFAADVQALFDADPADWVIHYGFRTRDEQQALYDHYVAGGPLAAPPGRSAHEYRLAVDFHEIDATGKDDWAVGPHWRRVMGTVDAHPRLHGGWHFPVADDDHIQSVRWYQVRAARQSAGTW